MIDTSNWKEFRIGDLFEQKRGKEASPNRVLDGNIPMINETSTNNGFTKYGKSEHILKGNAITVSVNYATTVFYQEHDFIASVNILVLYNENLNCRNAMFICAILRKAHEKYDYNHKISKDRLNDEIILLPATSSGEPDWDFMEQYIAELEEERVAELEEERVAELEAYLVSTGLDNYELTEEDRKVLSASPEWREFRIGDLFKLEKSKPALSKMDIQEEGLYPAFSSDTRNNGILGYTDIPDFKIKEGECRVIFGDHTRTMNITREDFSILDNVKILNPYKMDISDECLLYIFTRWKRAVPDRGYARHWKWAKEAEFKLPVLPDATPHFEYMEKYIRTIEKLTIKDVVEWKNKELEVTKQLLTKTNI